VNLPSDTILEFTNLNEWEELKKKTHWNWAYRRDSVEEEWEATASDEGITNDISLRDSPPPV
jgi:hypothetical protein